MRKLLCGQTSSAFAKNYCSSVIVFDKARLYILAREVRYGIHMCDEAECRTAFITLGRRDMTVNIALVIHFRILNPKCAKLADQHPRKVELPFGGRYGRTFLTAGGMNDHIVQKSFVCFHVEISFRNLRIHYSINKAALHPKVCIAAKHIHYFGNRTDTVVPTFSSLSSRISAPYSIATRLTIASPSPVPPSRLLLLLSTR